MNPFISIVIPTYNRPVLLGRLLGSLRMQQIPQSWFQVIVVSDGPDGQTSVLVDGLIREGYKNLIHLMLRQRSGPAAARNKGWLHASAELIAFTDDDCIADPYWAAAYLQAWKNRPMIAFTGRVDVPVSEKCTDYEYTIKGLETAEFITANCCLTRRVLELTGGFDENFKVAWREDSDLHFKLLRKEIAIVRIQEARIVHPVRCAAWGISLKEQHKSVYDALLYKKFPLLYRQRIAASPPFLYYGMILAFAGGLCLMLFNHGMFLFLIPWILLVVYFTYIRIRYTSKSFRHLLEMLFTSAMIPFLSVFWRINGAIRFKTFFL